jgi:hypothetical protein
VYHCPLGRSEIEPWRNPKNYLFFNKLQVEEDLRSRLLRYECPSAIFATCGGQKSKRPTNKKEKSMKGNRLTFATVSLVTGILASILFAGTAQAQGRPPAYAGKFTLTQQVRWGNGLLQSGTYTITINSTGSPIVATIRNAKGDAVTNVVSGARASSADGANALLIKEKEGRLTVYSLALADLGMVLIYDSALAREALQEARVSQTVQVMWVKK